MELILNGDKVFLDSDISVNEFLITKGFDLDKIAVERDGEILPKSKWQSTMMSDGVSYEVVEFVGGG